MTINSPNQPNRSHQQNGYNPITIHDLQKPAQSSAQDLFGGLIAPVPRWAAAPFFGFVFFYSQRMPFLAPLLVLILLSCLLSRMEEQTRKIAAVPLSLSAIKLSFQMAEDTSYAFWIPGASHGPDDACFYWLPVFFSICLVFIPKRESVTFKIVFAASCVLLASGLLPGRGFVAIFYMLDYLLFIAIVVGIFMDLATHLSTRPQHTPQPATN